MDPRLPSWLPHRPPALLLEGVAKADAQGGTALARVDPGAWYADADGAMPAWVGLELMAQAVAACRGRSLADAGAPPRGGYLVGVREDPVPGPGLPRRRRPGGAHAPGTGGSRRAAALPV